MINHLDRLSTIYGYMDKRLEKVWGPEFFGPSFQPVMVNVWRGHTKTIATELHLTHAAVHEAITKLNTLGCTTLMLRGSRMHKSVYLLHFAPTAELWGNQQERDLITGRFQPATKDQRNRDAINRLHTEVRRLAHRVEMLERGKNH